MRRASRACLHVRRRHPSPRARAVPPFRPPPPHLDHGPSAQPQVHVDARALGQLSAVRERRAPVDRARARGGARGRQQRRRRRAPRHLHGAPPNQDLHGQR